MFRDFPECSGMFRNVPRSGLYRRPTSSVEQVSEIRATPVWEATLTSRDYIVKPSGSLVSFLQGKLGSSLVSFDESVLLVLDRFMSCCCLFSGMKDVLLSEL